MKKFVCICVTILSVFLLTGCVLDSDRNDILEQLTKENIIKKDWEQINYYIEHGWSSGMSKTDGYGYIYRDKNGNLYNVYISDKSVKINDTDRAFTAQIFKIDSVDDTVETIDNCQSKCFTYNADETTEKNKYIYDENTYDIYKITREYKQFLIFRHKKYIVEKVNQ